MMTMLACIALTQVFSVPEPPADLRCEYLRSPLAVDAPAPRLSWMLRDTARSARQTAYQIIVASTPELAANAAGDVWDSGKVASDQTAQVAYAGPLLKSATRYHWRVRSWDSQDTPSDWSETAVWGMGLLAPGDWTSEWIGDPTPAPAMAPPHNGYHSALCAASDSEKWVTIDLGAPMAFDSVRLYPARPFDWTPDTPGFLFPLRFRVDVSDDASFATFKTVHDATAVDAPLPGMDPQKYAFPQVTARYVRLHVTALRERDPGNFAFALAEMMVLANGNNLALGRPVTALDSTDAPSWSPAKLTDGDVYPHPGGFDGALPAPMLRKDFALDGGIKRATLFATALGAYELRMNGAVVSPNHLAPEWTDYRKRVQYQAYDVTELLREGDNALGVFLGDGWYAGRIGMSQGLAGKLRAIYGRKPAFRMEMLVTMADGSTRRVVSDGTWRATTEGPIRVSDILDGEVYDARRETPGWDAPGFDASAWSPAEVVKPECGVLSGQPCETLVAKDFTPAISLAEPKPGVFIFDVGQNIVGVVQMKLRGVAGREVVFRHGEMLNEDGTLYVENLRGAPCIDHYILKGDPAGEVFQPHFTYHGFRYVEVTGLEQPPAQSDLRGVTVRSDIPDGTSFTCSNPMLNQLWSNILHTLYANMFSVPTDCPQRDERLGWQGDYQAFSQTAALTLDMASFFTKTVRDQRDAQLPDGAYPDVVPYIAAQGFSGAPAWGDAGVIVPWTAYLNYGDKRLLEEHFDSARRWVDFVSERNPDHIWREARGNDYGDWLNSDTLIMEGRSATGGEMPKEAFATAFHAYSASLLARMARVLGKSEEAARYEKLFGEIKAAFNKAYVSPDGSILGDTQAGYGLTLHFGLLPEELRPAATEKLLAAIGRFGGRLSTGIESTHRAMLALADNGQVDKAYEILLQEDMPSWGYMISQGATTIWERWDGFVAGRGFQNPGMNSFNHWAFGSVGEWMYRVIAGLNPDENAPGWRHFSIRPIPGGGLTHARAVYPGPSGRITVEWRIVEDRFILSVVIPPNTTASIRMPVNGGAAGITVSSSSEPSYAGHPLTQADGLRVTSEEPGAVIMEAAAGSYELEGALAR